ncbi:interleukin-5 receptor subunit alpha-like isoform X2 [Rhinatrema bivittatum]|uniref:interleukin-5 receptor subunit alpha-like isoform X2 n=1 Tax=Rhinatrema bivittatum TaxID=194408 RepID=UPI00112B7B0F|nr:interleukin-5 receptor subunit alpha-like isoform X2 [Rhinatrema bivittatum]
MEYSRARYVMEPVISIPALLIVGLTMWKTFTSASMVPKEQNLVLSSPNVTISKYGCGFVVLTWDPKLTKRMKSFTANYVFFYQYLHPKALEMQFQEQTDNNFAKIALKSYPGFNFKVRTQLRKSTGILVEESNWTEFNYQVPAAPTHNLLCVVYNISNLECTWNIKKETPEDLQFFFSFSYKKHNFQCLQYLTNAEKRNIGCHMKDVDFRVPKRTRPRIRATVSTKDSAAQLNRSFLTLRIEKLTPPINISVSYGKGNTTIHWSPPATIGSTQKSCFLYQVILNQSNKEQYFRNINTMEEEYRFPDYDQRKRYSIQVRAKKTCIESKYWGEWSEPVFIGEEDEIIKPWLLMLIAIFSAIVLRILLGGFCKRYKGFDVFFTPVPEPSHKIRQWLTSEANQLQEIKSLQNAVTADDYNTLALEEGARGRMQKPQRK